MIDKIKEVPIPTWIVIILVTSVISLSVFIFKGVCDDIKVIQEDKADRASIVKLLNNMTKQQDANTADLKEQRKEQAIRDERQNQLIQNILIQQAKDSKKQ